MKLLIASGNAHKLVEMRALLSGLPLEIVGPSDLGIEFDVAETGATYSENAEIKAKAYADASGLAALADDSGLEVDALGGAPGIYSARYGGPGLSDVDRVRLLLERLRGTPTEKRAAQFRCALALSAPDGRLWRAEGRCEGSIAEAPRGAGGFGYDPVFFVAGTARTMGELPAEEKNLISHRANAVSAMRPWLAALRIPATT